MKSRSLLSTLLIGAMVSFGACGDGGEGGGKGGAGGSAGSGGSSARGGSGGSAGSGGSSARGGSGGTTTRADAGRDAPVQGGRTGGAGGAGGSGGARRDGGGDVPLATGGTGGVDASQGVDGAQGPEVPIDVGAPTKLHLYVGCADSSGTIQAYSLNGATGAVAPLATFLAGGAISNIEFNDAEDRAYIAHVINNASVVSTFTRNKTSGALALLGSPVAAPYYPEGLGLDGGIDGAAPSTNAGPQTLTFDRGRRFLAVPNYFNGYLFVYDLAADGSVKSRVATHTAGDKAHHAVFTLNNKFLLVPYLGSNFIEVYDFDGDTGEVTPKGNTALPADNSGPRHLALHGNGKWLYAINETAGGNDSPAGAIDLFSVDEQTGTLTAEDTFAVPLPDGYSGAKNGSEIEIAPAGDLLFVSMRLDNAAPGSLVSYRIKQDTGALTLIEQESSHGATPRHFSLTKDGRLLVVGNQNSDTIAVFSVDPATGDMTFLHDRDVCDSPRFARMTLVQ
ncbi:MAG: lactonase family protein [Deltaproteobacteria bacterium]|nr:lactonase family protein [Deltaproteobacteria bacterium]